MKSLNETLKTLTTLEKAVLKEMSKSDFGTAWLTYYDEIDYNTTEFNKNQISGILSSLSKKGLVTNYETRVNFDTIKGFMLAYFPSKIFEDVKDIYEFEEQIRGVLI